MQNGGIVNGTNENGKTDIVEKTEGDYQEDMVNEIKVRALVRNKVGFKVFKHFFPFLFQWILFVIYTELK